MSLTLGGINLDSAAPQRLAEFYAAVLGGEVDAYEDYRYVRAEGFPLLCVQPVAGPRAGRNPVHLDLSCAVGERAAEVARVVELGAVHRWDVLDEVPYLEWSVLTDPEGNLFCIAAPRS